MHRKRLLIGAGAVFGLGAIAATAIAATPGGSEHDTPITGEALQKASAAALAQTGGGHVTGTEQGDEDSYYEVEVTLADGSQVDVQLDEQFTVVSQSADNDSTEHKDASGESENAAGDTDAIQHEADGEDGDHAD